MKRALAVAPFVLIGGLAAVGADHLHALADPRPVCLTGLTDPTKVAHSAGFAHRAG